MKIQLLLGLTLTLSFGVQAQELSGYTLNEDSADCGGFAKVNVGTQADHCVGIVASAEDGLRRPRRIIQIEGGDFLITDMYGWVANRGIVWRYFAKEKKLQKILTGVDHAHGLAQGPDGLVYVGERSKIFRFDPNHPEATKEYVITNLPLEGSHPLTHFIFDKEGDLYVNAGAPSDQCLDEDKKPIYPCVYEDEAAIRKYFRTSNGEYDANFKVVALGLRNSMGLAIHPETGQLYQAENNMDFDLDDGPKEEVNQIIEGAHYGWPYCYDDGLLNPKYKRTFFNRRIPKINCQSYEAPVATLPSHSAPLDMLFYQGDMFPELKGKLLLSLHGYRETGHRIVSLDLNKNDSYNEIVNEWSAKEGVRPKGAPVGMTVAKDGSLWFVEDKNKTIMVLKKGEKAQEREEQDSASFVIRDAMVNEYSTLSKSIFANRCQSCHSSFQGTEDESLKSLIQEGWIKPGEAEKSPLYLRIKDGDFGRQMPPTPKKLSTEEVNQVKDFINGLKD